MSRTTRSFRQSTLPAFLALSCVGSFTTAPALAAEDEPNGAGPQSPGDDQDILVNGKYQQEVVSTKSVAPVLNTPRSLTIVSSDVIKDTGSATLVDALRTVPGITFGAAEGGNPIGDRPFIRGYDSQGSTFVDGVRDTASQSRETFAIDQIQIVRGSDSTLGGRGSAGGSLNIISKLPRNTTSAAGTISYGTDDYKRVTADVNYRIADGVAFRVNGMWHDQDVAGRDSIWQKRWGIAPSVAFGLGSDNQLTLDYYHMQSKELPDSGIPYLYTCNATICNAPDGFSYSEPALGDVTTASGQTGHVDRDTFYGLKDRDFRKAKTDQLTARVQHDFGEIKIRNTTRYSRNSQSYIYTQPDDQQGNVFGNPRNLTGQPGGQVWRRANTRYGWVKNIVNQTDLFGKFMTGSIEHSFAVGAEFSWERARRGTFVLATGSTISPRCSQGNIDRYNCTSLFEPNSNDPWVNYAGDLLTNTTPITKTLPIQETLNTSNTKSVYAFDSITLTPWLIANLGARFDSYKSAVTPGQAVTATETFTLRRSDDLFNWQAGLVAKPTPNTSIYASYSTSATPPNSLIGEGSEGNALGTTNTPAAIALLDALKVEKTKSYEVGGKADILDGRLSLTIAAFKTETNNARVTGPNNIAEFIGKKKVKGIELGFNGAILPKWNVFGGYTYLDAKIADAGFTALTAPAIMATDGTVIAAAKTVLVTSANDGRQFPQTAKHSFTIWTNYEVLPGFSLGGGAFYSSRVFGNFSDNRAATQTAAGVVTVSPATKIIGRSVPSYWRFDARIGYEITKQIELTVNIQNLTDKAYFNQVFTNHYAGIAAGRSAFATVNFKY